MFNVGGGQNVVTVKSRIKPTMDDAERKARRREIREKIAACEIAERRLHEIDAAIRDREDIKDAEASSHVADAGPIQERLAAIERQQIASIVARKPLDLAIDAERKTLVDSLADKNAALEEKIAAEDRRINALRIERQKVAECCGSANLLTDLFLTGRRDLVIANRVASSAHNHARARLRAAQDNVNRWPEDERAAELQAAAAEVERTAAEAEQSYQRILDE